MSTNTDPVRSRMAGANPAPADAEPPGEVLSAAVLLDLIDERSGEMTHTTKTREQRPAGLRQRPRGWAWALAGGFMLAMLAVGVVVLIGGSNSPDIAGVTSDTTVLAEDSPQITEAPQVTAPVPLATPVPTAVPPATVTQQPATNGSWTRVPDLEVFGDGVISDIVAHGSGFVAVGIEPGFVGTPTVWISDDGLEWTPVPDTVGVFDEQVIGMELSKVNGTLVLVGTGLAEGVIFTSAVWTSPDGASWSRIPDDAEVFDGPSITALTAGGPGLVAIGEYGAAVWTSPDGVSWTRIPGDAGVFDGGRINDLTAGGPGLVAVGEADGVGGDAAVWTSVDGAIWSRVADDVQFGGPGNQWMDAVTSGPAGLVAVGTSYTEAGGARGAVWTSADGFRWTRVPNDDAVFAAMLAENNESTMNLSDVAAGGPGYVAVGGEAVILQSVVLVSLDGQTWTREPPSQISIFVSSIIVEAGPEGVLVTGERPWTVRDGDDVPTAPDTVIDMWIFAP